MQYRKRLASLITLLLLSMAVMLFPGNRPPVANAGYDRYVAYDMIQLDGSDSFDPEAVALSYRWNQLSGPSLTISGNETATPTVSAFIPGDSVQHCQFELTVSDGFLESKDQVSIYIVPDYGGSTGYLVLQNPPFDPDRPTIIAYGGGDCSCGFPFTLTESPEWYRQANFFTGNYCPPYEHIANELIVYLSEEAPDYREAIQTIGYSTGANPAVAIANYLNQNYRDPRYAVNRISLLDSTCRDYQADLTQFYSIPIEGESQWADLYRVSATYIPGPVNILFTDGSHSTPFKWYRKSASTDNWDGSDIYNDGLTAGYYISVIGPGRHFTPTSDQTRYFFQWQSASPNTLSHFDEPQYPGRIPQAVVLSGPEDGMLISSGGDILSCEESLHASRYQLVFGSTADKMDQIINDSDTPPTGLVTALPHNPTYWTVRIFDAHGSSLHAKPRALYSSFPAVSPIVRIIDPEPGSTVSGQIPIRIDAQSSIGIQKIRLLIDNRLKTTITTPPWQFEWNSYPDANSHHLVKIIAYNQNGDKATCRAEYLVQNMTIQLEAERKSIVTWLINTPLIELQVTVDNPNQQVPVHRYLLYKKIAGTGVFHELTSFDASTLTNGVYNYVDKDILSDTQYSYRVQAFDSQDRLLAKSLEVTR